MRSLLFLASLGFAAAAESGINAWLRYAPISTGNARHALPASIVALNSTQTSPVYTAGQELQKGFQGILGQSIGVSHSSVNTAKEVVVGTVGAYASGCGSTKHVPELEADGFYLSIKGSSVQILGQNERGALYGAFEYLSMLAQGNFSQVSYASNPSAPIRWTNEWDNMDGSIERGFAGPSIFFANGTIVSNLTRAAEYARLLASIKINGVVVNNVNANATTITPRNIQGLGRIADVFRPYGIQLGLSLNFASPQTLGNLTTFDPLDPAVVAFWHNVTEQIYESVPDFCGYLVKANSEGQPGPLTYNRTLADGANLFAGALEPHGGVVMFRAFVYDSQHLNESHWTEDRANAQEQFFGDLDGKFMDNVVVQIKYGPIDFQVREPVSPLFVHLPNTNTAIELQVTQEYLGQQCHLVYLAPLWKEIFDFDLRDQNQTTLTRDVLTGKRYKRPLGGYAGVVNVGTNATWLGSHLSLSNLYAYGRMAWDPTVNPESILQDWIRLTFNSNQKVIDTITQMSMESWPAYENYTGNLGIQTLTDILYTHYGPNPQSQDNNPWGQWTRADMDSIGMDRTIENGTGFAGQYPPQVAQMYDNIETTPDNLLLWFHHVPYTQVLHSGETVIQHFYNAHYNGAMTAQTFVPLWESLKGLIDDQQYSEQLFRQIYQAGHSIVWRDAIVNFYHNLSGIADTAGRVGNHPMRIEAESMTLSGYKPYRVSPFEVGSNYTAIVTSTNTTTGTASAVVNFPSGNYDIGVNYFDQYGGKANYTVYLNNKQIGNWIGNNEDTLGHTPSIYIDGHSASRVTITNVTVAKGDTLKIVGVPNGIEAAPLDYVVFNPAGHIAVD